MVVQGHLLIIPKKHINGFAEFTTKELNEVQKFVEEVTNKIKNI